MQPTPTAPSARRLLRESAPIAAILAVWSLPTVLVRGGTEQALLVGGLLMAGLYAVVRGSHLASECSPAVEPTDLADLLRENGRILAVAGAWFVAAQVLQLVAGSVFELSYLRFLSVPLFALNGAGAGAVLLYAVAAGRARLARDDGGEATEAGPNPSGAPPADG